MRRPAPPDGSGGLRRSIMLRGRLDRGLRGRPGLRGRADLGRSLRARQGLGGRRGADLRRRLGARQSLARRRRVLRRGIARRGVVAQASHTHADQNNRTEHRDVLYVMMRLSVDVSIESSRRQSPDGSARPMQNNVRTPTPPSLSGALPARMSPRGTWRTAAPTRNGDFPSRWPRDGGGSSKPVILADSCSPPQGWPWQGIGNRRGLVD
jgi:hypothetical protein